MNKARINSLQHQRARYLRKHATDAENHLWKYLRCRFLGGYRFRRQVPLGKYIADFVCPWKKLIIELDGGQHAERQKEDEARTKSLESMGYRVLRFWNQEALAETGSVLEMILKELQKER